MYNVRPSTGLHSTAMTRILVLSLCMRRTATLIPTNYTHENVKSKRTQTEMQIKRNTITAYNNASSKATESQKLNPVIQPVDQ